MPPGCYKHSWWHWADGTATAAQRPHPADRDSVGRARTAHEGWATPAPAELDWGWPLPEAGGDSGPRDEAGEVGPSRPLHSGTSTRPPALRLIGGASGRVRAQGRAGDLHHLDHRGRGPVRHRSGGFPTRFYRACWGGQFSRASPGHRHRSPPAGLLHRAMWYGPFYHDHVRCQRVRQPPVTLMASPRPLTSEHPPRKWVSPAWLGSRRGRGQSAPPPRRRFRCSGVKVEGRQHILPPSCPRPWLPTTPARSVVRWLYDCSRRPSWPPRGPGRYPFLA